MLEAMAFVLVGPQKGPPLPLLKDLETLSTIVNNLVTALVAVFGVALVYSLLARPTTLEPQVVGEVERLDNKTYIIATPSVTNPGLGIRPKIDHYLTRLQVSGRTRVSEDWQVLELVPIFQETLAVESASAESVGTGGVAFSPAVTTGSSVWIEIPQGEYLVCKLDIYLGIKKSSLSFLSKEPVLWHASSLVRLE
jgi:hypothetical protein